MTSTTGSRQLTTFLIVAASSLFFCSKGVFIKRAYQWGADPITILTVRMLLALPVFAGVALWLNRRAEQALTARQWWTIIGLGFLGYYFSAIVNFSGLEYVSVGLERMILYSYPSLVVVGSVVFLKKKWSPGVVVAMAIAYLGILIAFQGEASSGKPTAETLFGSGLIFLSAVSYAAFVLMSGELLHTLGALRFTANVLVCSVVFVVLHYLCRYPVASLAQVELPVWKDGAILALFGTILPSFLLGIGLKRAGAQRFAIISTIGPVGTVALAWWVLGERMNGAQTIGLVLTLAGGLGVSLRK